MIRTLLHDPRTGETRRGNEEQLSEWSENPDLWVWADFDNEELIGEKKNFLERFGLDPLVIADAQRERHPPKLEVFHEYFFLLLQGLDKGTTDIDFKTIQISFFLGDRFLITRRKAESVSIDSTWLEAEQGKFEVARGPSHIVYRILRRMTDRYTAVVEGLEDRLETMEDEMFENPRDALLEELIGYGRNLKRLQRIFNYHQGLTERLSRKGGSVH